MNWRHDTQIWFFSNRFGEWPEWVTPLKVADAGAKAKVAIVCKNQNWKRPSTARHKGNSLSDQPESGQLLHIKGHHGCRGFISNPAAVEQVVKNTRKALRDLVKWGVNRQKRKGISTCTVKADIQDSPSHTTPTTRVWNRRGLMEAVCRHPNITILENHFAVKSSPTPFGHRSDTPHAGHRMLRCFTS